MREARLNDESALGVFPEAAGLQGTNTQTVVNTEDPVAPSPSH